MSDPKNNKDWETSIGAKLLTKQQLADRYQLSSRTINELMRRRILPYYRIGGKIVRFDAQKCDIAMANYEYRSVYDKQIQQELALRNNDVTPPVVYHQPELFPLTPGWKAA